MANQSKSTAPAKVASLTDRALVRVGGPDAEHFLQGLATCDLSGMAVGNARFGALLSPQGKILFDFFVIRGADNFILDVSAPLRDDLLRRLAIYKLRARVEIDPFDPRTSVHAAWGGEIPPVDGIGVVDPRLAALGHRLYCRRPPEGKVGDYEAHRIALGIPAGGKDFAYGSAFPHETLMDQNGGVDFAKGCFVGQEVVSRMQHRGTARNRFVKVAAKVALPPPSTPILAAGKSCGEMGSSSGTIGLAVIRMDRAAEAIAAGGGLTAGSIAIEAEIPEWAKFQWPAAAGAS